MRYDGGEREGKGCRFYCVEGLLCLRKVEKLGEGEEVSRRRGGIRDIYREGKAVKVGRMSLQTLFGGKLLCDGRNVFEKLMLKVNANVR